MTPTVRGTSTATHRGTSRRSGMVTRVSSAPCVSRPRRSRICALAGLAHEASAALAADLVRVAPKGLSRVFYTDDGSTSVEVAVKIALQTWQHLGSPKKSRFVALDGAYHGDTIGCSSLGGVEVFRRPVASVLFDCVRTPFPDPNAYERAFDAIRDIVLKEKDSIAAVIVEPLLQGTAGMGATLATDRIYDAFRGGTDRALWYGHTFCGNPIGAALAREVLAIYEDEGVVAQASAKGPRIAAGFERIAAIPGVARVRRLGMVGAADLEVGGGAPGGSGTSYLGWLGWRVFEEARKRGAYLRPLGDTVYVCRPLVIGEQDLDDLLCILEESVRAALA